MLGVVAALALSGPALASTHRAIDPVVNVSRKRRTGLFNRLPHRSSSSLAGRSPLRISVAQAKRHAAKCRNQRRHKRLIRG